MHVDGMENRGDTLKQVPKIKSEETEMFWKGRFKLHSWCLRSRMCRNQTT